MDLKFGASEVCLVKDHEEAKQPLAKRSTSLGVEVMQNLAIVTLYADRVMSSDARFVSHELQFHYDSATTEFKLLAG
jgi:hypothetical protein